MPGLSLLCVFAAVASLVGALEVEVQPLDAGDAHSLEPADVSKPAVDVKKLQRQNAEFASLLKEFQHSEVTKRKVLREAHERELGEGMDSCKAKCQGAAACHGVFVHSKTQACEQMMGEQQLALNGLELGESTGHEDCMKECDAKGPSCRGIYVAKGGTECHMVLEEPSNAHLSGGSQSSTGVEQSEGAQKQVTVNVNVQNYKNDPDPAQKDGVPAKALNSEVEAAAKEAAPEVAEEAKKADEAGAKDAAEKAPEEAEAKKEDTGTKKEDTEAKKEEAEAKKEDTEAKKEDTEAKKDETEAKKEEPPAW